MTSGTHQMHPRVLVAQGQQANGLQGVFVRIPGPATGKPVMYLISGDGVQEVTICKPRFSSWFVDNQVVSDGGLYMCTPIDILFLLLPVLGQHSSKAGAQANMFCALDALLLDSPAAALMDARAHAEQHLPCICDVKCISEVLYFRLNDQKVMAWLLCKVQQTLRAFRQLPAWFASNQDQHSQLTYVVGFLGEYLAKPWHDKLLQHYKLEQAGAPESQQAAKTASAELPDKRQKVDPKESAKKKAADAREQTRQAQLSKQAAGTRKISAFFSKPIKPAA